MTRRKKHVETERRWAVVVSGDGRSWIADRHHDRGVHRSRAEARAHLGRMKAVAPGLPARVVRVEVTVREI